MSDKQLLVKFLIAQGDDAVVLGHRLSEWCSNAPYLEEDIALTNFALDHIGQAEVLLHFAGNVENNGRSEDDLSYRRDAEDFMNLKLVEQPNTDFAFVIGRQFLLDVYQCLLYQKLSKSTNDELAGMAARFLKESIYHQRHSAAWIERLGQGTNESLGRMQHALNQLWPYTAEMFVDNPAWANLIESGVVPSATELKKEWYERVSKVLTLSGLNMPKASAEDDSLNQSIYLEQLLAEMQYLPRTYPDAKW